MSSASNSSDRKLDNLAPTEFLPTDPSKKVYEDTLAFDSSGSGTKNPSLLGEVKAGENSEPVAPPTSFGRYRIVKLLGRGGMGSVYLAQDTQLDRPVALKIPRMEADRHGRMMARFEREAKAVALLNHPHICPVFDVGEIDGQPFLAMAYIKGKPLSSFLAKGSQQPERGIASTVYKIALAIQEAHANGILHRDLKPANIMIDSRGEPIVMDFGLSHRLNDDGESRLTQEGTVIGTPSYMAPEQIDGREPISPATDVYSLGVVLYELLTGKCPFQGSIVSVIGQVLHNDPPPIEEARADLSPAMIEICKRAMAKEPGDRYASMKDFAAALASFLRGQTTVVATKPMTVPTAAQPDLTSGSLEDLFSSSELQAALATSSLHTLPAPGANGNQLLRVLVPATVGILILLGVVAFAFRARTPVADSANKASSSDTTVIQTEDDESQAKAQPSSQEAETSSANSENADSSDSASDDFFPKEVKTFSGTQTDDTSDSAGGDSSPGAPAGGESTEEPAITQPADNNDQVSAAEDSITKTPDTTKPPTSDVAVVTPVPTTNGSTSSTPEPNPLSLSGGPGSGASAGQAALEVESEGGKDVDKSSPEYLLKMFRKADTNGNDNLEPHETPMHIIHRADKNKDHYASLREMQTAFKLYKEKLFYPPTAAELKMLQRGPGKRGKPPGPPPGGFGPGGPPPPPPR